MNLSELKAQAEAGDRGAMGRLRREAARTFNGSLKRWCIETAQAIAEAEVAADVDVIVGAIVGAGFIEEGADNA